MMAVLWMANSILQHTAYRAGKGFIKISCGFKHIENIEQGLQVIRTARSWN